MHQHHCRRRVEARVENLTLNGRSSPETENEKNLKLERKSMVIPTFDNGVDFVLNANVFYLVLKLRTTLHAWKYIWQHLVCHRNDKCSADDVNCLKFAFKKHTFFNHTKAFC